MSLFIFPRRIQMGHLRTFIYRIIALDLSKWAQLFEKFCLSGFLLSWLVHPKEYTWELRKALKIKFCKNFEKRQLFFFDMRFLSKCDRFSEFKLFDDFKTLVQGFTFLFRYAVILLLIDGAGLLTLRSPLTWKFCWEYGSSAMTSIKSIRPEKYFV